MATLESDINLKIDSFVLLQPTGPTREVEDIIGAIYVVYRACFFIDQQMIWPDTQLFEMVDENLVDGGYRHTARLRNRQYDYKRTAET